MNFFLLKSEPSCYSIDDLEKEKITSWTGVRNYQARNILRDSMNIWDICFFYHSNCKTPGIVWLMRVSSKALPDMTALEIRNDHYDAKSTLKKPIWIMRELDFIEKFEVLSLQEIKNHPLLSDMILTQKGSRLSVQKVSKKHFQILSAILKV